MDVDEKDIELKKEDSVLNIHFNDSDEEMLDNDGFEEVESSLA